jgi:hypothetical protein
MQRITGTVLKTGALVIALALAGCGGGGGGDSAPAADTTVAQRDVQGTAAKGLIKHAKVSVYAIDAQGVRASAALATATTGTDGSYKLQVPASQRNFVIEVSAAPGAVMADEASGTDIAIPDTMKLRSVVTLADNATGPYQGTVSPLTEMVARTAESADGKLPPQAVAQAKTGVRTLLGFDPETVKPVNSNSDAAATANEEEKNQSLALAAISKMASTASAECAQSSHGERIACVVSNMAASVSIKDGQPALKQETLAQFREAIDTVAKDKTINRTGKDKVAGLPVLTPPPATTPTTPAPAPAPVLTPVQATKALFSSLRTNVRSIGEGDAFSATADAIKADLNGTVVPLGHDVSGMAALAVNALDYLDRYRADPLLPVRPAVWYNQVYASAAEDISMSLWDGVGSCEITPGALSISCTVVQNAYLPGATSTAAGYTQVYLTGTITLQPKDGSKSDFSYTASKEKNVATFAPVANPACPYCGTSYALQGTPTRELLGRTVTGDLTYARTGNTVTQIAVKGSMPGRTDANGAFENDSEYWLLNATRTQEANNVALYKFGGAFTSMKAGQVAGTIEIDNASFLRVAQQGANNAVAPNPANELLVTLRGIAGSTTVSGTLRASEHKQDKSKTTQMPTKVSFEGSLKHKDATVFSGNVAITRNGFENFDATAGESETNFVADTVSIGGALSVPNRPTLGLTLGATRTGLSAADISAQYRDGTSVINVSVSAKVGERHPLVKVASADGVAFSFSSTSAPVQVTKDGAVVAQLDLTKGMVTYSDGSTQSLK